MTGSKEQIQGAQIIRNKIKKKKPTLDISYLNC